MKFSILYEELKFSDVFAPASPEEVEERKKKYSEMKVKEALDNAKKTKLSDGTWSVDDDLDISDCHLSTLENLNVSIVYGNFNCTNNKLTSLEGAPRKVKGSFISISNKLTSLIGAPIEIGGFFSCFGNILTSLEGAPLKVKEKFDCSSNKLTSLEGAPKKVGKGFYCYDNTKKFTREEVASMCEVRGTIVV